MQCICISEKHNPSVFLNVFSWKANESSLFVSDFIVQKRFIGLIIFCFLGLAFEQITQKHYPKMD
jgi:hypothetical protein